MSSSSFEIAMQGRIMALELLMRGHVTSRACQSPDPLAFAKNEKSSMIASLQNIDRSIDEYTDEVVGEASRSLRFTYDQVIQRLEHLQEQGHLPPQESA